jgi:hypothetical protein
MKSKATPEITIFALSCMYLECSLGIVHNALMAPIMSYLLALFSIAFFSILYSESYFVIYKGMS